jgi:serine/threonine protein kinase
MCYTRAYLDIVFSFLSRAQSASIPSVGGTLEERIHKTEKPMSYVEVLHCSRHIAAGLQHLHPTYVHRDLKPANILLDTHGSPKITGASNADHRALSKQHNYLLIIIIYSNVLIFTFFCSPVPLLPRLWVTKTLAWRIRPAMPWTPKWLLMQLELLLTWRPSNMMAPTPLRYPHRLLFLL